MWINHTLKKYNVIVKELSTKFARQNIKCWIIIPRDVNNAYDFDKLNKNELWDAAIEKELYRVRVAFRTLEDNIYLPVGSTKIPYNLIFDVKFDLSRKAWLVTGGDKHKDVPSNSSYTPVVSRNSVIIIFLHATLDDLKILASDIGDACFNAPYKENVHFIVRSDLFGPEYENKRAIIVRALYGLKFAGNTWREHISTQIRDTFGYQPCTANLDVYIKAEKRTDCTTYYSYIVVYMDSIRYIDEKLKEIMDRIGEIYRMKNGIINMPKTYLGANIKMEAWRWRWHQFRVLGNKLWELYAIYYGSRWSAHGKTQSKLHIH